MYKPCGSEQSPESVCCPRSGGSQAAAWVNKYSAQTFLRLFSASAAERVIPGCSREPVWALQGCDKGVLSWLAKADGNPTGAGREKKSKRGLTRHIIEFVSPFPIPARCELLRMQFESKPDPEIVWGRKSSPVRGCSAQGRGEVLSGVLGPGQDGCLCWGQAVGRSPARVSCSWSCCDQAAPQLVCRGRVSRDASVQELGKSVAFCKGEVIH